MCGMARSYAETCIQNVKNQIVLSLKFKSRKSQKFLIKKMIIKVE